MSDSVLKLLERIQSAQLNARSSSALNPVLWLVATCTTGATINGALGGPEWLTIGLGASAAAAVVTTLGLAVYFAVKSPDLLRSEKYVIQKMAIERGSIGDSTTGLIDGAKQPDSPLVLPTPASHE